LAYISQRLARLFFPKGTYCAVQSDLSPACPKIKLKRFETYKEVSVKEATVMTKEDLKKAIENKTDKILIEGELAINIHWLFGLRKYLQYMQVAACLLIVFPVFRIVLPQVLGWMRTFGSAPIVISSEINGSYFLLFFFIFITQIILSRFSIKNYRKFETDLSSHSPRIRIKRKGFP
jgi:hypothetical protein